ncbi:MAG: alkaline shock response membrane anchor protein AmaP [Clostridia bacterium]|nr:alkaline shock response membrane anchor protein AmaP [Clostridia bacterium]
MKILERLALVLFSIAMTIIAVVSCLVIFNVVELESIYKSVEGVIKDDTGSKIIVASSIITILLSIKALLFPTKIKKKQEVKTGVLLENRDGRLLISRDTIENLVNSVVKSFSEAMEVQTKINLDFENNITVYISLLVREDAVISELSSSIQNKIKETIKRNTGLEVNQVNINIRDIESNKKVAKANNQAKVNVNNVKINENTKYESKPYDNKLTQRAGEKTTIAVHNDGNSLQGSNFGVNNFEGSKAKEIKFEPSKLENSGVQESNFAVSNLEENKMQETQGIQMQENGFEVKKTEEVKVEESTVE